MRIKGFIKTLWISFTNNVILEASMSIGVISAIARFFVEPSTPKYGLLAEISLWSFVVALFTICWMFAHGAACKCMRRNRKESG